MGRRVYLKSSEIEAIRQAIDFIESNIDGADDDFYKDTQEEVIEPLTRIKSKYYRLI